MQTKTSRQQSAQPEQRAVQAQPGLAGHKPNPLGNAGVLRSLQRSHGNRFVNRLLQTTITRTACSCGSSTGSMGECEECSTLALNAPGPTDRGMPSTTTLQSDGDTETISNADTQSTSTETDGRDTTTIDGDSPCSVTGSFSTIPSGTVAATLSGTKLGAVFSMIGSFAASIPCNCSCGEYRQSIRGTFTKNGSNVTHALCGTNLHATNFQEDCGIFGGTQYRYGYRSQQFATSKFTNPDQAGGCKFEGQDSPGITGSSGDVLAMNLDFEGKLIDTCNNTVLATSAWTVSGTGTVA